MERIVVLCNRLYALMKTPGAKLFFFLGVCNGDDVRSKVNLVIWRFLKTDLVGFLWLCKTNTRVWGLLKYNGSLNTTQNPHLIVVIQ